MLSYENIDKKKEKYLLSSTYFTCFISTLFFLLYEERDQIKIVSALFIAFIILILLVFF